MPRSELVDRAEAMNARFYKSRRTHEWRWRHSPPTAIDMTDPLSYWQGPFRSKESAAADAVRRLGKRVRHG